MRYMAAMIVGIGYCDRAFPSKRDIHNQVVSMYQIKPIHCVFFGCLIRLVKCAFPMATNAQRQIIRSGFGYLAYRGTQNVC